MSPERDESTVRFDHPVLVGRYEILQPVGRGGMGSLYLARDPKIDRQVVIKVLKEGLNTASLRERFAREAQAAGGLRHANIVTIFDVGEFDNQPFIAMEYIQGETLTDLIFRQAPLSLTRKIQLMEELCSGLHYAHRAGIVHRDIKPANIMVDQDGVLKILDFGIARLGGSSQMTQTGAVIGTLNYMAPEQMAGQPLDARADMFSAGAVFYELLSSTQAFPGEPPAIFHKIVAAVHQPLPTVMPDGDQELMAVVERCLAVDRADRYADMAAVRRELVPIRTRYVAREQHELQDHLEEARGAMRAGNPEAVLQACEQALVLDSDCTAAMDLQLEAQALFKKQQVNAFLTKTRAALDQGALTLASELVDETLKLDPRSAEAEANRQAIEAERRRLAAALERQQTVKAAIARAAQQLNSNPELALNLVNEALAIDPAHVEGRALRAQIQAVLERREADKRARARLEHEARAQAAIQKARDDVESGHFAAAIAALQAFSPPELVADVLEDIKREADEIERRRIEDEHDVEDRRRRQAQQPSGPAVTPDDPQTIRVSPDVAEQRAREALRDPTAERIGRRKIDPGDQPRRYPQQDQQEPTIVQRPPVVEPDSPFVRPEPPVQKDRSRAPIKDREKRRSPLVAIGVIAVAIVALVAVGIWKMSTPPVEAVAMVIDVAPWAKITAITQLDGTVVGQRDLVTPCVVSLPPGTYHLQATNPDFAPLEADFSVVARSPGKVRFEMPGLDIEKEASSIVNR